jgi:hypothetical protein
MLQEIEADNSSDTLYLSPLLSNVGKQDYPDLLKTAVELYDDK